MKKAKNEDGGVMMILSPAKTLDLKPFEPPSPSFLRATTPSCAPDKTRTIAATLKKIGGKALGKLLGVSPKLAETARGYYADFELDATKRDWAETKPALFAFSGAAYQGLQASSCTEEAVAYLQNNLRIIDPLYGTLRPMDLIQPYRLEMATKKVLKAEDMGDAKDLAGWWREAVTATIGKELDSRGTKILINLASDEYSAAVDPGSLPEATQYVKIVFQQEGRVLAVHAKRARGLMVRYISENNVRDLESIKEFDAEGYRFIEKKSKDDSLVFDRAKQPTANARKKAPEAPEVKARVSKRARRSK